MSTPELNGTHCEDLTKKGVNPHNKGKDHGNRNPGCLAGNRGFMILVSCLIKGTWPTNASNCRKMRMGDRSFAVVCMGQGPEKETNGGQVSCPFLIIAEWENERTLKMLV